LDSSRSDTNEESNIGFVTDVANNSMPEDLDNEVDFINIDSSHLAYQEAISNNGMIASSYKTLKKNYKNACKEIELMQQEKASLNDISLKNIASPRKKKDCVMKIDTLKATLLLRTKISKTWKNNLC